MHRGTKLRLQAPTRKLGQDEEEKGEVENKERNGVKKRKEKRSYFALWTWTRAWFEVSPLSRGYVRTLAPRRERER